MTKKQGPEYLYYLTIAGETKLVPGGGTINSEADIEASVVTRLQNFGNVPEVIHVTDEFFAKCVDKRKRPSKNDILEEMRKLTGEYLRDADWSGSYGITNSPTLRIFGYENPRVTIVFRVQGAKFDLGLVTKLKERFQTDKIKAELHVDRDYRRPEGEEPSDPGPDDYTEYEIEEAFL